MSDATQSKANREYDPDAEHAFPDERLNEVLEFVTDDPEITTYLDALKVNQV